MISKEVRMFEKPVEDTTYIPTPSPALLAARLIEYTFQILGIAAAIIFGIWSVKAYQCSLTANELALEANKLTVRASELASTANQLALLSFCTSNDDPGFNRTCEAVLDFMASGGGAGLDAIALQTGMKMIPVSSSSTASSAPPKNLPSWPTSSSPPSSNSRSLTTMASALYFLNPSSSPSDQQTPPRPPSSSTTDRFDSVSDSVDDDSLSSRGAEPPTHAAGPTHAKPVATGGSLRPPQSDSPTFVHPPSINSSSNTPQADSVNAEEDWTLDEEVLLGQTRVHLGLGFVVLSVFTLIIVCKQRRRSYHLYRELKK
ncbi:hypothetical protein R3P38DRAFT_2794140 [Favolaschia claudopus]|uniref:Uncharacterized protein n=1 Tax=Favolaschia claudopus TaxID=2862362 RepID=A0AAW0AC70_9AGAR